MIEQRTRTCAWWRPLAVLAAAFIALFVATGIAAPPQPLPLQAAVALWAEEHPGEPVPLIVQHDGTPDDLLSFVRRSGGAIEREFDIIPAVDLEIPAGLVDDLARQDDVTWVSLDAPVMSTAVASASSVGTAYPFAVNAPQTWPTATGAGVTVAVIDTGVSADAQQDFSNGAGGLRLQWVSPNPSLAATADGFGHGSHVGGIVAGESTQTVPAGKYTGIAPGANVLAMRIADDQGNATVGDLMGALQFVDENRQTYGIRVVSLSVSSSVAQSYTVDPLDAAVEILWFHGIVVVVAAGNTGDAPDAVYYPPANDPFVITVGGFDDMGTLDQGDDRLASWSSRGQTQDGFAKPEVLAPGANIVSPISANSFLATNYPAYVVERVGSTAYFRMSGTSMAAPVVSGTAALMLQGHPQWSPGQVKAILAQTSRSVSGQGAGVLADQAVAYSGPHRSADHGIRPSSVLLSALGVAEADFDGIRWVDALFDGIRWAGLEKNGIRWMDVDWSGIRWSSIELAGIRWSATDFNGIRWYGIRWYAFVSPSECDDETDSCTLDGIAHAPDAADTGVDQANDRASSGGSGSGGN